MKLKNYTFEKESNNQWYIVLPEWDGPKQDLQMVDGADTLLDVLSDNTSKVNLTFSDKSFDDAQLTLKLLRQENGGGRYILDNIDGFTVWLCKVTKFVFGYLPKSIFVKRDIYCV